MSADMNSLVPAILRVTVFLVAAGLFSLALRRRTAAVRHLVWTAALAGALAIPFLSGALPRWTIPVWADLVPAQGVALFRVDAAAQVPNRAPNVREGLRTGTQPLGQSTSTAAARDWRSAVLVIWCLGALAVVLQTLLGTVAVIRLKRRALPAQPAVAAPDTRTQPGDGTRHGNPSPDNRRRNHADDLGHFPPRGPAPCRRRRR